MSHCSQPFSADFLEFIENTCDEFEEICHQILNKKIQFNDENEIIDSNFDLLRKFQLKNMFLNI